MNSQIYVVSRRHDRSSELPDDWQDRIQSLPGVIVAARLPARMQLAAPLETLERIRTAYGDALIVEPIIHRSTSES